MKLHEPVYSCWHCFLDLALYGQTIYDRATGEHMDMANVVIKTTTGSALLPSSHQVLYVANFPPTE